MLRLALIALLLGIASPARAAEVPFAAPDYGAAPGRRFDTALAGDGRDYFAVWHEEHRGVVGARFTHGGELLDPAGIRIAPNVYRFNVIWTGQYYLVVWQTRNIGAYYTDTYARTVSAAGELGPVLTFGGIFDAQTPALATNGRTVAIVIGSTTFITDLAGHLIKRASGARFGSLLVRVAAVADGYAVLYGSGSHGSFDLSLITVSETAESQPRLLAKEASAATIASDGRSALIVWRDKTGIYSLTTGNPAPLAVPAIVTNNPFFELTWRNGEYLLGYGTWGRTNYLQRVSAEGALLGQPIHLTFGAGLGLALDIAIRPDGTAALLWLDEGTRVHAQLQNGWPFSIDQPLLVSRSARSHASVQLACTGRGVLAAWVEQEEMRSHLRLGYRGGNAITVEPVAGWIDIGNLIVMDDTVWLVWVHGASIYEPQKTLLVQRFTLDLAPQGSLIQLAFSQVYDLTAAAGVDGVAVVWGTGNGHGLDILSAVIPRHVDVPTGPRRIASGAFDIRPAVAWDGSAYVVAWSGQAAGAFALVAQRFDGAGVLSPVPLVLGRPPQYGHLIRATSSPDGAAFAWINSSNHPSTVQATVVRGETVQPARTVGQSDMAYSIAATPTGFGLLHDQAGALMLDELARDLTPKGRRVIAGSNLKAGPAEAVQCGGELAIAYTRRVDRPPFGGVTRAFYLSNVSGRTRSVRH